VQLFACEEELYKETKCSRTFRTVSMVQEHLKKFARKFQVSYLSFCTANEGESTTIKKKRKSLQYSTTIEHSNVFCLSNMIGNV
jgi:hypothetical protein